MMLYVRMTKADGEATKKVLEGTKGICEVYLNDEEQVFEETFVGMNVVLDEINLQFPMSFISLIQRAVELNG